MSEVCRSIPAVLRETTARHPELEAVVDGSVRLTYAELDRAVLAVARALLGIGVVPGDRVAIWAQNCWQWCVATLGICAAGAVTVPINTRFRGREAAQLIADSQPVALFTSTGFLGADYPAMLRSAAPEHAKLTTIVMTGDVAPGDRSWSEFLRGGAGITEAAALTRLESVGPDDLSDIMYTSGTTGFPKGVMQTHRKNLQAVTALGTSLGLRAGDRTLTLAPMFAQFGLRGGVYLDLIFGATTVVDAVFDTGRIIDIIEKERISVLPGPPTILMALLSPLADGRDISSLRIALIGSTVIPEELVMELLDRKVFEHVITGWGLTEACGIVSVSPLSDTPRQISTSAGKVVDFLQVKAVDPEGAALPAGAPGELLVRGPTIMNGYLGDSALTSRTVDPDGWLRTGDLGCVDAQGYVHITGRIKDMVIVGGFNVYPAEVEATIRTHPAVHDVGVVGMPDARLGEVVAAFVVAEQGKAIDPDSLIDWCRGELANHKAPRTVVMLDHLPLNSSLKVDKLALRERSAALREVPFKTGGPQATP
jgi:HIP---CoA ligase